MVFWAEGLRFLSRTIAGWWQFMVLERAAAEGPKGPVEFCKYEVFGAREQMDRYATFPLVL